MDVPIDYFVDLERLFPPIQPEDLLAESVKNRMEYLNDLELNYNRLDYSSINEVLEEAVRLDLQNSVKYELQQLCYILPSTYTKFFEISGHPLSSLLSSFVACVFGNRLNSIAELLDYPKHKAPNWRK